MTMIGNGVDLIRISRIANSIERYGERFLQRIFHIDEVNFARMRRKDAEFLAGCFAAKEAALKALGDFPGRGIAWRDIYITHEKTGKPILNWAGKAKRLHDEKRVRRSHVSITHDGDFAMAQVILEGE